MSYILALGLMHYADNNINFHLGFVAGDFSLHLENITVSERGVSAQLLDGRRSWFDRLRLMPAPDAPASNLVPIKHRYLLCRAPTIHGNRNHCCNMDHSGLHWICLCRVQRNLQHCLRTLIWLFMIHSILCHLPIRHNSHSTQPSYAFSPVVGKSPKDCRYIIGF